MSFMRKHTTSIEGFIPRQPGSQLGGLHDSPLKKRSASQPVSRELKTDGETTLSKDTIGQPRKGRLIGRDDIDESLREIDTLEPEEKW